MEWKGDIATALAVVHAGWRTEAEKIVLLSASDFLRGVAARHHEHVQKNATCRTCGHNPLGNEP